ncbi:sodium:solute symporter [Bacillus sp. FJAT-53711]|uniref:Sodium:solute symporter n=1 Tax=Bacillus yunxiaonensis TaxID=3127665 RepID=A0ABU8FPV5_9BACI
MSIALVIIFGFLLLSLYLGIRATRGKKMNLEQWSVGGRGFGTMFVFLLLAGEVYTTFTFLGASGWVYRSGTAALYVLAYITLAYILSYWLLPPIWKFSQKHQIVSQSDFFVKKFNSPYLGILVSIVGIIAVVPYFILQLKGLGIIVSETSYGSISPTAAIWIGAIAVTIYVMISGIHGSAWTAVIKDITILIVVVFLGLYIPYHYYGGIQPMFEAVHQTKPEFLTFPKEGLSISWFISTVLLSVLGFYMWPHALAPVFAAKNVKVFRKNAVILPVYTLMLLFIVFVGYTALLKVPDLKGAEGDLALLRISIMSFEPWVVGFIGAAGLLTALVPSSIMLMSASTLFSKNIYKFFVPSATEGQMMNVAKWAVPVITLISVYFALDKGNSLSTLLLMGYSLVTQLFPPLLFSLSKRNFVNKYGAFLGIICGIATVAYVTISKTSFSTLFPTLPSVVKDINIGFIALLVNTIIMVGVSMMTRTLEDGHRPLVQKEETKTII